MTTSSLPVGFRFHPTEEELIDHYLKNKINGQHAFDDVITEIDICSFEPWDLPRFSLIISGDEWFYFSRVDYKLKGNSRNRATQRGFWKKTGKEREIRAWGSKDLIGKKRILIFNIGKVRSFQKTCWVIHEYYIPEALLPKAARQRDFVLCRLKKKYDGSETGVCGEGEVFQTSRNDENLMAGLDSPIIQEDLPITLQDTQPEEDDYLLEDERPNTFFNQSHEPTTALHKVYEEGMDQQGLSLQDTNALPLNPLLQKQTSFVDADRKLAIGRAHSANVKEPKYKTICILEGGRSEEVLASLFTGTSSLNETRQRKGEILNYEAEVQCKLLPSMPLRSSAVPYPGRPGHYLLREKPMECEMPKVPKLLKPKPLEDKSTVTLQSGDSSSNALFSGERYPVFHTKSEIHTAESQSGLQFPLPTTWQDCHSAPPSYQGRQVYNLQALYQPCEKPKEPMKPMEDKQKIMRRKQTKTTTGDWTSSFIVWKESPIILASCPPAVYMGNMICGFVLFMFFVGVLVSFGKW